MTATPDPTGTPGTSQPDQPREPQPEQQPRAPHEDVEGVVTTDPGPQQEPGQGARSPEEVGTKPLEDPDGEPGFV